MKQILLVLIYCILLHQAYCVYGVDVSQLYSLATYQCIKNAGAHFASIRGYRSFGGVDANAVAGLTNAKAAGLVTDTYMFPCRGKNATSQVIEMMNAIPSNLYGMPWLDIQTNTNTGCSWADHDAASNCAYVTQLVNAFKARGKNPGIYSSSYMWTTILGSVNACPGVATQGLWYAHYDNNPSFTDFTKFGGWTKPNIKQYAGTTAVCGAETDSNYYP